MCLAEIEQCTNRFSCVHICATTDKKRTTICCCGLLAISPTINEFNVNAETSTFLDSHFIAHMISLFRIEICRFSRYKSTYGSSANFCVDGNPVNVRNLLYDERCATQTNNTRKIESIDPSGTVQAE